MAQMKGYNDLICLELDKKACVAWLSDLGEVSGSKASTATRGHLEEDRYIKKEQTKAEDMAITVAVDQETQGQGMEDADPEEDNVYDDEFEEIDEDALWPVCVMCLCFVLLALKMIQRIEREHSRWWLGTCFPWCLFDSSFKEVQTRF